MFVWRKSIFNLSSFWIVAAQLLGISEIASHNCSIKGKNWENSCYDHRALHIIWDINFPPPPIFLLLSWIKYFSKYVIQRRCPKFVDSNNMTNLQSNCCRKLLKIDERKWKLQFVLFSSWIKCNFPLVSVCWLVGRLV